jgi:sec-independent protein translocase protein TatA
MQVGMLAFLGPIGLPELVIIMVILIFIFGANRLSGIGKGIGQAIRGFKEEIKTDDKAENAESRGSE